MDEQKIHYWIDWALKRYRRDSDWEDLRQEAWVKVWTILTVRKPEAALSTVVVNAARWAALDFFRQRDRVREVPTETLPDWLRAPEARRPDDDLAAAQARVRGQVTARYWRLFQAHYEQGISQSELARREGVSLTRMHQIINTVKNRYRRELGLPERGWGPAQQASRNRRRLAERSDYRERRNARNRAYMARERAMIKAE